MSATSSTKWFYEYVYKVLKQVHPDTGITENARSLLNRFLLILSKKISIMANELRNDGQHTISSREIQTATRMILSGNLIKHAVSEGTKAVTRCITSIHAVKGKKRSKASKSNLQFPPPRMDKIIRSFMTGDQVGNTAPVYLAAVVEYICAEILELSGNVCRDSAKMTISTLHIIQAVDVNNDEELSTLFTDMLGEGWGLFGEKGFHVPQQRTYCTSESSKSVKSVKEHQGGFKSKSPKQYLVDRSVINDITRACVVKITKTRIAFGSGVIDYIRSIVEHETIQVFYNSYELSCRIGLRNTLQTKDFEVSIGLKLPLPDTQSLRPVKGSSKKEFPLQISHRQIRRLAFRAGVYNLSGLMYEQIQRFIANRINEIVSKAIMFVEHRRQKTVTIGDIWKSSDKKYLHPDIPFTTIIPTPI